MSSNTTAYFQQFAPISPLDYIPKQQGQGMDVENCKEWDWNYPNPKWSKLSLYNHFLLWSIFALDAEELFIVM